MTMACSLKHTTENTSTVIESTETTSLSAGPATPTLKLNGIARCSLPSDMGRPPLEFQWPPSTPVSAHTSNLRLNMMSQDPKDLHTARAMIEELRSKVKFQAEHIIKWRKAYVQQVQQLCRYQKEKGEQMNILTSQLLLLESRLKRKQKHISCLLNQRDVTIQKQQKIIDSLSSRLVDHGLQNIETSCSNEVDSLNDSDSAVVLEDIDSDSNVTLISCSRKANGGNFNNDGVTVARSISDAIKTNMTKYGIGRRNNCFLRRPEILETVYSVEEDPEPTADIIEKREKFRQRSMKALSSGSTDNQIDDCSLNKIQNTASETNQNTSQAKLLALLKDTPEVVSITVPTLQRHARSLEEQASTERPNTRNEDAEQTGIQKSQQMTNFNRVMSNHRSVTKPKDVKYKRINKAKSKSLEELRGRLKNLVEKSNDYHNGLKTTSLYHGNHIPQTAQSYA